MEENKIPYATRKALKRYLYHLIKELQDWYNCEDDEDYRSIDREAAQEYWRKALKLMGTIKKIVG